MAVVHNDLDIVAGNVIVPYAVQTRGQIFVDEPNRAIEPIIKWVFKGPLYRWCETIGRFVRGGPCMPWTCARRTITSLADREVAECSNRQNGKNVQIDGLIGRLTG